MERKLSEKKKGTEKIVLGHLGKEFDDHQCTISFTFI
jgi:hypothetical protein